MRAFYFFSAGYSDSEGVGCSRREKARGLLRSGYETLLRITVVFPHAKGPTYTFHKGESPAFKASREVLSLSYAPIVPHDTWNTTWSEMKPSVILSCKTRAPLFLVNCTRCRLWNYRLINALAIKIKNQNPQAKLLKFLQFKAFYQVSVLH